MTAVTRGILTAAARSVVEPAAHGDMLYVAIVHASDGIRLAAAGISRAAIVRQLADYVRRRCGDTLWADDARYVRTLLVRGELEAAVEVYFGRVGDRWGGEWLVTTAVAASAHSD